ncbi:SRPBCC family protein [Gimibacter soli]|uniref:SRPBCC family protein n=1 Tax=Gimibacter soli TaxID=3024400 RepID=A0AAE9XQX4_9PROT|nr:SRPBCC family protein [Gimibacter soli]WCL53466.1 SRPBCC family protein [Gimibacter soli]
MKKGTLQIQETIFMDAPAHKVWDVLLDAPQLVHWMPAVNEVLEWDQSGEKIGSERKCRATLAGRSGTINERVVAHLPGVSIHYAVIDDTFGMSKMFNNYSFELSTQNSHGSTVVTSRTYYDSKNIFVAIMNKLCMQKKFKKVISSMLIGLKSHAEKQK